MEQFRGFLASLQCQADPIGQVARTYPARGYGIKGVMWNKKQQRWIAVLRVGGMRPKHLGSFMDIEDAALAVAEARRLYHGDFANDGL